MSVYLSGQTFEPDELILCMTAVAKLILSLGLGINVGLS